MELILRAVPGDGKLQFDNKDDLFKYCIERKGVPQIVTIKDEVKVSEKLRMYRYLHGVVKPLTMEALRNDGWELVDEHVAYQYLKMNCAKDTRHNERTGQEMDVYYDARDMPKKRLLQFLNDCILLLEMRHQVICPDSQEYKVQMATGQDFKRVRKEKSLLDNFSKHGSDTSKYERFHGEAKDEQE